MKPIELDGRTGEGGGQLVRVAICLAALTGQAVKITNVRGNRDRGGGKQPSTLRRAFNIDDLAGLKSQHATAIRWLAEATDADVENLSIGSKTLTFVPRRPPTELLERNIKISAESGAASSLLILQAIFPFLLFAGNDSNEPIEVEISGGTNVSFSLSYEYLDQVLLPTLEDRFGIQVERKLKRRGWSLGPQSRGNIWLKTQPISPGQCLKFKATTPQKYPESYEVKRIDLSIVVPSHAHEKLQTLLVNDLGTLFPGADVHFKLVEDSGFDARWYILAVASSESGLRWGRDILSSLSKKAKSKDVFLAQVSSKLCRELFEEVEMGGQVDEHLQDQLVCFQALCDGYSTFPRGESPENPSPELLADAMGNLTIGEGRMRKEKNAEPSGNGSLHTRTARWVVGEFLDAAVFFNKGDIVKGAATCFV